MDFHQLNIPYKKYRIGFHTLFWFFAIATYTVTYGSYNDEYLNQLWINLMALPVKMTATYSMMYWLMPKFFYVKRYVLFVFLFIVSALLFSFIEWYWLHFFVYPIIYPESMAKGNSGCVYGVLVGIIHIYPIVIVGASVRIVKLWVQGLEKTKQLENEKLEAELKFLKAQIHPHFLFNTLNNLYALTLKKSDNAPDVVLKLSSLLDYMLYEANTQQVSLEKEVKHLQDYIELERLRYVNLQFAENIQGNIASKQIAPMLLLPFIENSFKHGVSNTVDNPFIDISLSVSEDEMVFEVKNSKSQQEVKKQSYSAGIGLKNVKRRLELLYKDRYSLNITEKEGKFTIVLKIKL